MGYNLFKNGINTMQSAEFSAASFAFKASKASPGIFFAAFGCILLSLCITENLSITNKTSPDKSLTETVVFNSKMELNSKVEMMQSISTLESIKNRIYKDA